MYFFYQSIKDYFATNNMKWKKIGEQIDHSFSEKLIKFCDHIDIFKEIYKYNFFGLCFLIFVFANRLFIEKIPKNLEIFYLILLTISVFMIIIQSVYLYNLSKTFISSLTTTNTRFIKKGYKKIIKHLHKEDRKAVRNFLYKWNLPERVVNTYGRLLSMFLHSQKFLKIYYKITCYVIPKIFEHSRVLYILIFVIPKIIICGIFFIDVFMLHQIVYFYKVLWLLLIPLIGRILLYTIKVFSTLRLHALSKIITYKIIDYDADITNLPRKQLCYSEDEQKVFYFFWSQQEFSKQASEETLFLIMTEVLNNRQIVLFAEDLYEIEMSKIQQAFKLLIVSATIIIWVNIMLLMLHHF